MKRLNIPQVKTINIKVEGFLGTNMNDCISYQRE
jgi:hypothetical protein